MPIKIDDIYWAEMATAKEEMYLQRIRPADSKDDPVFRDPRLSWQMGVKLIDLMQHHLESLVWIRQQGADPDQEQRASALELATRYYSSATRELERAVSWYQSLTEQGL